MRGTVAKRLRAETRKIAKPSDMKIVKVRKQGIMRGKLFSTYSLIYKIEGYRRIYQDAKKRYLQG